ncbi:CAF17-like 4Fe-4S cluster assembly/insertion protein YgfZ [Luteimonas sp. RIT-PG2_3]
MQLQGPDAGRFAQAQFMGDVDALTVGHWQWNGWLTPKGRVIALFALAKRADDDLLLLLLDADPEAFCSALGRFQFRSKLKISPRNDLLLSGAFRAPAVARADGFSALADGSLEFDMGTPRQPRVLQLGHPLPALPASDVSLLAQWRAFDLAHGLPRLPGAQASQWTPQQLSLDRLRAYSVKKGCYPGQEIVARTHFLGQAKRGLVRLHGADSAGAGSEGTASDGIEPAAVQATHEGSAAVPIVSRAGLEALAVFQLDADATRFAIDDVAVRALALEDGLAR